MKPKISLFTSLFKGKVHLKGFLEDITNQSFFRRSELILINANSPEKEEEEVPKKKQVILDKPSQSMDDDIIVEW